MSRPSHHLDRRLIAAARAMLPDTGFSGLSVREVARRAGVNVGMFHYHFKSKEEFVRRVLEEAYHDFLASFTEAAEGSGAARERLRRVLVAYAHFARRHRTIYSMMMRELLNGHGEMIAFARANFPKHGDRMMLLMEECRRTKVVRDLPAHVLTMFAMSSMGVPNVAATGLERSGKTKVYGQSVKEFIDMVLSDEMIETRADMVMAALAPARGGKR
jgi:AcrR family transcriptional regulator